MKVSVAHAKSKLPALIKAVENGQSVIICRRGAPVVDMIRATETRLARPRFGALKGKIKINDPNWWKPMTEGSRQSLPTRHSRCIADSK